MAIDDLMSPKQVHSIGAATGRVNIWEGAIRSGKTIASLFAFLLFVATAPRGGELVVIARTRDSAYRNVFSPLMDSTIFGIFADVVKYTHGGAEAKIFSRTVHVIGASDVKAEKVLRGMTVVGAYVDEITVIPEVFFTQLLGRMSVAGARLFGTTNPDSPAHWFKVKYLDRIGKLIDWRRFTFRIIDNPSLTADYVAQISAEFTGLWYRRFILGEWVAAEGAIYDMWDPDRHVVRWHALPRMDRILAVGVDYGTTNATAALTLGLAKRFDAAAQSYNGFDLYLLDEYRYDSREHQARLTDIQLSAGLRNWLHQPHTPHDSEPRPEYLFLDPAAASFRVQLEYDGERVSPADNAVEYGIRTVASLLSSHRLHSTDRTPGWNREVTGYSWDDKASLKGEDKPVKVADHSLDAGRYAIATTETIWRDYITS